MFGSSLLPAAKVTEPAAAPAAPGSAGLLLRGCGGSSAPGPPQPRRHCAVCLSDRAQLTPRLIPCLLPLLLRDAGTCC